MLKQLPSETRDERRCLSPTCLSCRLRADQTHMSTSSKSPLQSLALNIDLPKPAVVSPKSETKPGPADVYVVM
jgi:hypothetical protein